MRAPMITEVTAGLPSSQASATWAGEAPCAAAMSTSTSTVSYSFSWSRTGGSFHVPDTCLVPSDGDPLRRYLPDTRPPASGDQTRMPSPWSTASGTSSSSASRASSE